MHLLRTNACTTAIRGARVLICASKYHIVTIHGSRVSSETHNTVTCHHDTFCFLMLEDYSSLLIHGASHSRRISGILQFQPLDYHFRHF